ncbi:hypothetical protein [Paraburkholderia phosphatilytica]|uniref:hypothetical protein n=1 Tax=Paraburkholderia phosphatilytica TaxID=2282883 RepID=UPI000E4837FA|nr:hypothetical protein [Paraburkholderia phosphatilytica]
MSLTDWIVVLAITQLSIASFTTRSPLHCSPVNRARRVAGVRMLVQAVVAVWASLIIVGRDPLYAQGFLAAHLTPHTLIIAAFALMLCGVWWTFRASRLMKPRRIFG